MSTVSRAWVGKISQRQAHLPSTDSDAMVILSGTRIQNAAAAAVAAGVEMVLRVRQIGDSAILPIRAAIRAIAQPVVAIAVDHAGVAGAEDVIEIGRAGRRNLIALLLLMNKALSQLNQLVAERLIIGQLNAKVASAIGGRRTSKENHGSCLSVFPIKLTRNAGIHYGAGGIQFRHLQMWSLWIGYETVEVMLNHVIVGQRAARIGRRYPSAQARSVSRLRRSSVV